MSSNYNPRLSEKVERIVTGLDPRGNCEQIIALVGEVIVGAAVYWLDFDADDFCVQSLGPEVAVFGSTNRLVWSPSTGYVPDKSYCNERFYKRALHIGPLPQSRRHDV